MADEFVRVSPEEEDEFAPVKDRSFLQTLASETFGRPEALLALGSGMVAPIVAGFAGIGALPFGAEKAARTIETVQEALTYEPRTEMGKTLIKAISYPFELYGEHVVRPAGETVAGEAPGPGRAALAGLTEGILAAAPLAIPFVKKAAKGKPIPKAEPKFAPAVEEATKGIKSVWDRYLHPERFTAWDKSIRSMVGTVQLEGLKTLDFAKGLIEKLPDKSSREAVINYIQAGGDEALLINLAGKSKSPFAEGYLRASKFTPEEKATADAIHKRFDADFKKAYDAGILGDYFENYVPQIWDLKSKPGRALHAEANAGLLLKDPFFAKKRIFESYFEGEQAGLKPKNKDIAHLIQVHEHALAKSVATRAMVKELMEGTASDGRPLAHVAGYARTLTTEEVSRVVGREGRPLLPGEMIEALQNPEVQARFIRPKGRLEEFWEYRPAPDNPAFRKWKWIDADEAGKPIFLEGQINLHPEIAGKVNNTFRPSALRKYWPTRMLLKGSANLKGVLLSFSGFHQVQVAEHGIFHRVNPIKVPKIDYNNPLIQKLIKAGTIVFDYRGESLFSEGMVSYGLVHKIPGIGPYMQKYSNYLFGDYIPRLKIKMAIEAYQRNRHIKRYKHLTDDQIAMLTADQANAAFGQLNYAALGRNRTFQDFLRLTLLAPDFLEARLRFAGQALRPYGQEQLMAAGVRGTLMYYAGARIMNMILNDGDAKWDKPFSLIINNRDYSLRTVPGDVWHLVKDPRSFVMHRLNPTITRTAMEVITQRNFMGRWRSWDEEVLDFFQAHTPIPSQDLFSRIFGTGPGRRNARWWDSIMSAWGLVAKEERSQALQKALEINRRSAFAPVSKTEEKRGRLVQDYVDRLQEARRSEDPTDIDKIKVSIKADAQAGKLDAERVKRIIKNSANTPLQNAVKPMAIENALYVWEFMNPNEKWDTAILIAKKLQRLQPQRAIDLKEQIDAFAKEVKVLKAQRKITKDTVGEDIFEKVLESERAK